MSVLEVDPLRYAGLKPMGDSLLSSKSVRNGRACFELMVGDDHEIEVYLQAPDGRVLEVAIRVAHAVLAELAQFDVIVQRACASACASSALDSTHFESALAHVTITSEVITLHYCGAVVNTEWDEVFTMRDGAWIHSGSGLAAGSGAEVRSSMQVVFEGSGPFLLFRDGAAQFLSVMCGGVGIYTVEIELDGEEKARAEAEGRAFVHDLARQVANFPSRFMSRQVNGIIASAMTRAAIRWRKESDAAHDERS